MFVNKVENQEELMLKLAVGHHRPRKLQAIVERFALSEDKVIKVTYSPGEYKNAKSAQSALAKACTVSGYNIKTRMLDGELYLVKEAAL